MRERVYYVYILASRIGGTLYICVTSDLIRRVYQHHEKLMEGFTERYGVSRLVYYEMFGEIGAAIRREKQLKRWNRSWKIRLIEKKNPTPPSVSCPRRRESSNPWSSLSRRRWLLDRPVEPGDDN